MKSAAARVTKAAEGLPRRRFTVVEVEAMVAAGVMDEDERVELIGGELVPMSPKGNHHEVVKIALLRRWYRVAPDDLDLAPETTFRLSDDTYLEPDVVVFPSALEPKDLKSLQCAARRRNRRIPRDATIWGARRRSTPVSASAIYGSSTRSSSRRAFSANRALAATGKSEISPPLSGSFRSSRRKLSRCGWTNSDENRRVTIAGQPKP